MPKYADWWWEDLTENAVKAATVLGYSRDAWDEDEPIPYDEKPFPECSPSEKAAALFLGMAPLDGEKLDVWWDELDEETKKQAAVLGWTKELWDDDYDIQDLPCNEWYWKDMTDEQKAAALHFGYQENTWDETEEDIFELVGDDVDIKVPDKKKPDENKKVGSPINKVFGARKKADGEKKEGFSVSRFCGGESGTLFDQRNHHFIESIEVFHNKVVNGIKVTYCNHVIEKAGSEGGDHDKFQLEPGEFINKVDVRSEKLVQELTFYTSKGKKHGPFGGHGRLLKDKKGEVAEVSAPTNGALCGFMGRQSKHIDAIALRWGPAEDAAQK